MTLTERAMSQTGWQERRDFEERLHDGQNLTAQETQCLIEDADAGERSVAILEGLQLALKSRFGILLVDATTDDDEDGEIRIELIPAEDGLSPVTLKERDPDPTARLDSIGE